MKKDKEEIHAGIDELESAFKKESDLKKI